MSNVYRWLQSQSRPLVISTGFLFVLLIGLLDYLSGPELSFALFYLIPVILVSWLAGRQEGILIALSCGLAWFEAKKVGNQINFERHLILSDKPDEKMQGVQFSQLHAVDLYDMDGDGIKDIVTGKRRWAHGPEGDVNPGAPPVLYWFRLTRDGGKPTFTPQLIDDDSGVGTQVMACDINGDKKGDVVVGNKHGQFILIQEPEKTAKRPSKRVRRTG